MALFKPKKHSKNIVFAPFFIKNDSKTRIFTLKNEQKSIVFYGFKAETVPVWYSLVTAFILR
jgi:hypothetical protein